ncbi:hypothetical protein FRC06_011813 [Ceratobasidium sp. 370]|nr:hypothetical protein FRC06_011813 [Ceratobasidium sp. 370]
MSVEDAGGSTDCSNSSFNIENTDDLFMRSQCDANRLADQLPSAGQHDNDGWETESEDVEPISIKGSEFC